MPDATHQPVPEGLTLEAGGVLIQNRPPWEPSAMSLIAFVVAGCLWDAAVDSTGVAVVVFAVFMFAIGTGALALRGWARSRVRLSRCPSGGYSLQVLGLPAHVFSRSGGLTRGIEGDARRSSQLGSRSHLVENPYDYAPLSHEEIAHQRLLDSDPHVPMENLYITLDDDNRFLCRRHGTQLNAVQDFLGDYLRG